MTTQPPFIFDMFTRKALIGNNICELATFGVVCVGRALGRSQRFMAVQKFALAAIVDQADNST
jgi:hypothetical protein